MPAIKISPTDGLYTAIEAYAEKHKLSLARASAELVAQALGYDETPVQAHGGDRTQSVEIKDNKEKQVSLGIHTQVDNNKSE